MSEQSTNRKCASKNPLLSQADKTDSLPVEKLSVEEARRDFALLFNLMQKRLNLDDEATAAAVSIAVGICPHCYDSSRGCKCCDDS